MTTTPAPGSGRPLPAARTPVGPAAAGFVGLVLALVVVALGVVALREALVGWGVLTGTGWVSASADWLESLVPAPWAIAVAVASVLLGLWLLVTALRPRRLTGIPVRSTTGVFLRPADVQRVAVSAAEDVDGVLSASAFASARKVTVQARTTGASGTDELVRHAVTERLAALATPPTVRVRTTSEVSS